MNAIQIFGYFASLVILVSLSMNSIRLLRWVNLAGATMFAIYGFAIKAYPVGILNSTIATVDIFYLAKMYLHKEYFRVIKVRGNNFYLLEFLEFYKKDIRKFFPGFEYKPELNRYSFFVLRDMQVAGIVLGREYAQGILKISLDYTIPQFRDFKTGKFIYRNYSKNFAQDGYKKIIVFPETRKLQRYFKKMGFVKAPGFGPKAMILELE